ncbi:protein fam59a [Plakobranchus ocellatus]|uniref:Protein fam59a n=1 Tax=Plakobranchus ocellatus TaxID=259542 RepID=A0AAV4DV06_9GAST|nr:protein fam59a [Plakobranchus ocellatus]
MIERPSRPEYHTVHRHSNRGWFELVPSDFSRATCYTSIESVAKVMPNKFFTRSNLKGIRIEGEGEQQKYMERKIPAASVLRTNGTFKAKWKTRAETGLFKKKTKEWDMEEITYLKCLDHDDSEILVPFSHKGKFNSIYDRGKITANAVYSMKDILSELSLPIMVRLLFGKAPVLPCIFTGMLIVRETAFDDLIVGSTILNKRNILFEIPVTAPVKVKYTSTDAHFAESENYKDAQKLCQKYSHLFSTNIKLSPDLDTGQKVMQHVPSDPSVMRQSDEALRALDLITDISLTSGPQDHHLDSSDAGSMGSQDQQTVIPAGATIVDQSEYDYKSRESHTHV